MNYSKYKFTLNTQTHTSQRSFPVKLGDTARSLYIILIDGGTPFSLPDADTFVGLENYRNGVEKTGFFSAFALPT